MDNNINSQIGGNQKNIVKNVKNGLFGNLFFRRKMSLFFIFIFILFISFSFDFLSKKQSNTPDLMFNVVDYIGSIEVLHSDNTTSIVSNGALTFNEGDFLITHSDSNIIIEVNGHGYISIDSDTKLRFESFITKNNNGALNLEKATLYLESGHFWINNVYNPVEYNIFTNKTLVVPGDAIFEMAYNGLVLDVYNHNHDVNIGLLVDNYTNLKKNDSIDNLFYNYFFLPEGNKIKISESKITEKLNTILLSKLVKEFPFNLVLSEDLIKDKWLRKNLEMDNQMLSNYNEKYVDLLHDQFIIRGFVHLQELFFEHIEENKFIFIVSEDKKNSSKAEYLSKIFDIGQNWSLDSNVTEAQLNSERFYSYWQRSLSYLRFDQRDYLYTELNYMKGIFDTSNLYSGKERLWDTSFDKFKSFKDYEGIINLLNINLEEVYDLLDQSEQIIALSHFVEWSANLHLLLGAFKIDEIQPYYKDIEVLRQMVVNLFFRYSSFYADDYFSTLILIDQKILDFVPDKLEQEEIRQTMIQDRIKILKKLSFLMQNDKIDNEEGINLGLIMLSSIHDLRAQALYRVAIYNVFDKEIADQEFLFEFFASPEFVLVKGDFEERLDAFKNSREDWEDLQSYIENVKSSDGKVRRINVDKLTAEVYEQFAKQKIFPKDIVFTGDNQQRLFIISDASVSGTVFSGSFDNETKLIFNLNIDGKVLPKGVHIDRLREVVKSINLIDLGVKDDSNNYDYIDEHSQISSAEDLALTLVTDELSDIGFFVTKNEVEIIDLIENTFYISEVALDNFPYLLSFEYDNKTDELIKIIIQFDEEENFGTFYVKDLIKVENLLDNLLLQVEQYQTNTKVAKPVVPVKGKVKR